MQSLQKIKVKPKTKSESVIITLNNVYSDKNNTLEQVGVGFTVAKVKDGVLIPVLGDLKGNELMQGDYIVKHYGEDYLGVISWVIQ